MNLINKWCSTSTSKICLFLAAMGPGIIVMLADTDAGSLITAAQSGAVWGYKLIALQIILIPILYITQELTVRLGIVSGCGHAELIKKHFGKFWAYVSVTTLVICCIGALITELSGIAGVGELFGVPIWLSMVLTTVFLIWLVWTKSYHSVERIALAIGAFELIYIFIAWQAHPSIHEILQNLTSMPLHNHSYLYLMSANIGAVIMPWMIFYQQSAIIDKGLTSKHLGAARLETAIGAVITQVIMMTVIIAIAATIGKSTPGKSLDSVQHISAAITPFMGDTIGRILFALGMLGASLVATIVVSLTAAWSIGELTGFKRSLQDHPKDAPWFYGIYFVVIILGGILISSNIHLVSLNVTIEVMNALLLPIVIGFLYLLAYKTLPEPHRLKGWYALVVGIILFTTCCFGFISGIWGFWGNL